MRQRQEYRLLKKCRLLHDGQLLDSLLLRAHVKTVDPHLL